MSRIQQFQSSFSHGEIDPLLRGRVDIEQYYSSVSKAKNVLFEPQGGFSRRPGLRFIADYTTSIDQTDAIKLVPFEYSTGQTYMLVLTIQSASNDTLRIFVYKDGVLQTNINSSGNNYVDYDFTTGKVSGTTLNLRQLNYTQSTDTLIFVNRNIAPFKLVRGATDTTWTASQITLTQPYVRGTILGAAASVSLPSATLTPSATTGAIKLTASASVFASGNVNQYVYLNTATTGSVWNGFGKAQITKYISGTVVEAVVEVAFPNTDAVAEDLWPLDASYIEPWSSTYGHVHTVTFHEGRLYFGGSYTMPMTLFASKVGEFFNFKPAEGLDDDAFLITLSTDALNTIVGLRSGRDLQVFTTGGEFFIPQADLDPITPSNISVKSTTKRGSKDGIKPVATEGGTFFIQRQGKALREMLFSDVELSYVANNISLLASHLIVDPQSMAIRPSTDTTEGDLLMIVNGTSTTGYRAASSGLGGTLACFMLHKQQNIVAPSYFQTNGTFLDVAVDLDEIYAVVKRSMPTQATFTITVTDYANIAVGTTIKFFKQDGTEITLQSEASSGSAPSSSSGNTHYFRPNESNDTTADNIYTAINAISGFTVANPGANVVTVQRDAYGNDYQTVTSSDTTRLTSTNFSDATPTKYYLEVFDDDYTTDSAVQKTSSFSGTSYTLLAHLPYFTSAIVRDDIVDTSVEVNGSGVITTGGVPTSYVEAGLDFSVEVITNPAAPRLPSGTVVTQKKRILEVSPIMYRTQNLTVNGYEVPLATLPYSGGGTVPTITGIKKVHGLVGYDTDAQVTISQSKPVFCTVLSLDYKLATGS